MFLIGLAIVLYVMFAWWSDVVHEGQTGDHTPVVRIGLRYGFILFIMSEVMFFVAWFWTFFKHRMYPMGPESPWVDGVWPPAGIETFDPWHLPLINTLVLLLSGCAVTWAHHALVHENNRKDLINGLTIGIGWACLHRAAGLRIQPRAFGFAGTTSMARLLHGDRLPRLPRRRRHDLPDFVCLIRALKGHFTPEQHVGFEAAAWYWHFVDVVWLFLFFAVYVWGQG
jgi:cytochrome c oxidase subunit 3